MPLAVSDSLGIFESKILGIPAIYHVVELVKASLAMHKTRHSSVSIEILKIVEVYNR